MHRLGSQGHLLRPLQNLAQILLHAVEQPVEIRSSRADLIHAGHRDAMGEVQRGTDVFDGLLNGGKPAPDQMKQLHPHRAGHQ
jgi:hypothetical protein